MLLIVILILGIAVVLLLKHFFGMKYPLLKSEKVVSLPGLQVFVGVTCIGMVIGMFSITLNEFYMGNGEFNEFEGIAAFISNVTLLVSLIGYPALLIISIKHLYQTFNFIQYKSSQLLWSFSTMNYGLSILFTFTSISAIILCLQTEDSLSILYTQIFLILIGLTCLIILFIKKKDYKESVEKLYENEYSESIETTIVKGIKQTIPDTIRQSQQNKAVNSSNNTKKCPYCGEEILAVAKKCRYCGEWLDKSQKIVEYIECPTCGEKVEKGIDVCPFCHEFIHEKKSNTTPISHSISQEDKKSKPIISYKKWKTVAFIAVICIIIISLLFILWPKESVVVNSATPDSNTQYQSLKEDSKELCEDNNWNKKYIQDDSGSSIEQAPYIQNKVSIFEFIDDSEKPKKLDLFITLDPLHGIVISNNEDKGSFWGEEPVILIQLSEDENFIIPSDYYEGNLYVKDETAISSLINIMERGDFFLDITYKFYEREYHQIAKIENQLYGVKEALSHIKTSNSFDNYFSKVY